MTPVSDKIIIFCQSKDSFTLRNGNIDEQFKCVISQIAIALVQNSLKFSVKKAGKNKIKQKLHQF